MTYTELLESNLLFLPISQNVHPFRATLINRLQCYLDAIEALDDAPIGIPGIPHIDGLYIKEVQRSFIRSLLEVIDIYHDGKPARAYTRLDDALRSELKDFTEILKIRTYEPGESFFRMRIRKGNVPFMRTEMFHIPFQLRGLVATQRFSIPGFPCLYLGRTLYGCWEELNRPDINEFQAIRFKSLSPIKYLDLTRPTYDDNLLTRDIYHYFMTWPLIACCSMKVKDYSHAFKSEYIMPQLLLQWVRENNVIDGIRFNSTHINFHESASTGDFSNLVMPVKTNTENGFYQELQGFFEGTEPISWQLQQHSTGGQTFIFSRDDFAIINQRIQRLELIKGKTYPYSYSILGQLEWYLEQMDTFPLEES